MITPHNHNLIIWKHNTDYSKNWRLNIFFLQKNKFSTVDIKNSFWVELLQSVASKVVKISYIEQ